MKRKRMERWRLAAMTAGALALCGIARPGSPQGVQQPDFEQRAIARVTRLPAKRLDAALPQKPFAAWFREGVGADAKIEWELSDCGEQTGNPETDKDRDFPACVDACATLGDGRRVSVQVVVGTLSQGFVGKPTVFFISIIRRNNEIERVDRLRDLRQALVAARPKP